MSEIKQVKDAVQEAKNDLEKEKQDALKRKVKSIIRATLEKIEQEEKIIKEHQDILSILRKDLKDLELGRLDLIEERQQKDELAKRVSVVIVKKVEKLAQPVRFVGYQPWYWPFELTPNYPGLSWVNDLSITDGGVSSDFVTTCINNVSNSFMTLTGSNISDFAPGTYTLGSGNTVDIRPRFN